MNFRVHSNSPEKTIEAGKKLGRQLKGKEIILISGPLGVGKTLFTKGIAAAKGIAPEEVVSPTFVLMNAYYGDVPIFHFDLYRLGLHGKINDPGIDEYIGEGLIVVEWAQYLANDSFPFQEVAYISLTSKTEDSRQIEIQTCLNYINK